MKSFNLSRTWERIRTTPGLGRDVSAIAAMVLVGVVGVVVILTSLAKGGPFEDRTRVKVEFAAVNGLNPNSQPKVTIAGVEVGYVDGAENTDRGTALVSLNLEEGHPVFQNARVVLRPKNPLNDMQIEVNPGGPPAAPLPDDGYVPASQTERPIQADEVLGHLDDRTQSAVTTLLTQADAALVRAPQELPGGLDGTRDTLVRLRPVVDQLQSRRANIGELVTALSQISQSVGRNDQRVARLADTTQQALGVLARNDGALKESINQVPGLSDELKNALSGTQRLTKQLDPTLDNLKKASDDLPDALDGFQGTVTRLDKVVDAAGPFIKEAKPVVADLRPFVEDLDDSLRYLKPVTGRLPKDSNIIVSYLTELRAFVYNTRSVFGAGDAQGSIIRGHAVVPSGGFVLPQDGGTTPGDKVTQESRANGSIAGLPKSAPAGSPAGALMGGGR